MKKMNPKTKTRILAILGLIGLGLFVIATVAVDIWAFNYFFG